MIKEMRMNFRTCRSYATLVIAGWLTALLGCHPGSDRPPVYPASGTILINGEPPIGALLSLHPSGEPPDGLANARPYAKVSDDGKFRLSTFEPDDGAPAGHYYVTLFWPPDPDSDAPQGDRLQGRLSNSRDSELRITIDVGDNDLGMLSLDGVRVLPPAGSREDLGRRGPPGS